MTKEENLDRLERQFRWGVGLLGAVIGFYIGFIFATDVYLDRLESKKKRERLDAIVIEARESRERLQEQIEALQKTLQGEGQ